MTMPSGEASPDVVNKFHARSDKDASSTAQHHTLGIDANQAAAGNHTHDGKNSKKLGKGFNTGFPTLAAGAYSAVQMQAVIDALRDLGYGS